jgi:nitrilase
MTTHDVIKIAAAQIAPVFLNRDATVDKVCGYIRRAAGEGARLVAFPEALIPTYPDWVWAVPPSDGGLLGDLYGELLDNSVAIPSDATDRLCEAARDSGIFVAIGLNERNIEASGSSLYNTVLYIDDSGKILGKHRKLVPTAAERLVWAQGDGSTLGVYDTAIGKLGGLTCWENYMPLARYAMYAWGTEIYVAATWDRGDTWLATLQHIAKEGGVYVVGCCMALRKSDIREDLRERLYAGADEWINVGNSAIVEPGGRIIVGPASMTEEILYADVDPSLLRGSKWMLDVAGHYARPDIFELIVHAESHPMISASEPDSRTAPAEHVSP